MAAAKEKKSKGDAEEDVGSSDSEDLSEEEDYYIDDDGTKVRDLDELHERDAEAFLELDAVLRGMGLRRGWAPAYVDQLKTKKQKTRSPASGGEPKPKKKKTSNE
jgi:hypothetical protein